MRLHVAMVLVALLLWPASLAAQAAFVNWESPHVHPIDLTPNGRRLLAVNTADNRLEVFDTAGPELVSLGSVPVGLDPVSVRARTNGEAWVVNHVSDSVSIVDLVTQRVVATLQTDNEPADVVFAGAPSRAFVSCSEPSTVLVFQVENPLLPPVRLTIDAEEPKALARSRAGDKVYLAIFESGNRSTVLRGEDVPNLVSPPNAVSLPTSPYGGINPPPNAGSGFNPPKNPANPQPKGMGLIVKKDVEGRWMDDNEGDWTSIVSGPDADGSGRLEGWDLPDHDVAVIDTATLSVSYIDHLMNLCMAIAVHPVDGRLAVVGTDATNAIRFEPNLNGHFLRVLVALATPSVPDATVTDLNPHLDYHQSTIEQALRDMSVGDPRGVAWHTDGTRAYVSGMGSNNVIVLDDSGNRAGLAPTIEVGEGPTGLAFKPGADRLYVLNKFEASISVVDTVEEDEIARVSFFDPSPKAVRRGRKHLYDTHATSGLGHIACASCHVDARFDRLAWDLGDPSGAMRPFNQNCPDGDCRNWHPMKGPMLTQTLTDIVGKEPLHWRGDRDGLEEFNGAFMSLQGDDAGLTPEQMQEFEDFLGTIHVAPNPFRNFDNSLPANLPLPDHFTSGRFAPAGMPLPNGNAVNGLALFRPPNLVDGGVACVTCHALPSGLGTDHELVGDVFVPIPPGPNGERHHAIVSIEGSANVSIKVPHLRNVYERVGFDLTQLTNRAGFGYLHDGTIDSLSQFVSEPLFLLENDQQVADLVAFVLSFAGSDLPQGSTDDFFEPLGTASKDTHAGVGTQTTLRDVGNPAPGQLALVGSMLALADTNAVGLVARARQGGLPRGYAYLGNNLFQSDRLAEVRTTGALLATALPESELTLTVVPFGSQTRIGIDRDRDGAFDQDELDAGTDPLDRHSYPGAPPSPHLDEHASIPGDTPSPGALRSGFDKR